MNQLLTRSSRAAFLASVVLCLFAARTALAASVKWTVVISGPGKVVWSTSSPAANGVFQKSGRLTFDSGAFVDLTFQANAGAELTQVLKNGDDWTAFLDGNDHFEFGPVTNIHVIVAKFEVIVPTGRFGFDAPQSSPLVPSMVDITGNYTGVSPSRHRRNYSIDVAMDEDGKLDVMGTLAGVEPEGGGPIRGTGTITTVNGEPTARCKGTFEGTRDGVEGTAKGSGSGVVEVKDIGGGANGAEGMTTYKGVLGGVPFDDKNVPVQVPLDAAQISNLHKAWSLQLDINKDVSTGKTRIVATARLVLPNGDTIDFPARTVKYSAKNGYSVALNKGANTTRDPDVLDKKTKVTIKKMTLRQEGAGWRPTGGSLDYRFLGQKGKASLLDFLTP